MRKKNAMLLIVCIIVSLAVIIMVYFSTQQRNEVKTAGACVDKDQKAYSEGALIRIDGKIYQCRKGKWVSSE